MARPFMPSSSPSPTQTPWDIPFAYRRTPRATMMTLTGQGSSFDVRRLFHLPPARTKALMQRSGANTRRLCCIGTDVRLREGTARRAMTLAVVQIVRELIFHGGQLCTQATSCCRSAIRSPASANTIGCSWCVRGSSHMDRLVNFNVQSRQPSGHGQIDSSGHLVRGAFDGSG